MNRHEAARAREARKQQTAMARAEAWRMHRRALERAPFTAEEQARWATMMVDTWHYIADDYCAAAEQEPRLRITPAVVVEAVCDANRLETMAGMTAEEGAFLSAIYHRRTFQRWARGTMRGYAEYDR